MIRKVSAEDIAIRGNGTGLEYMCPTWHFVYIFFNPVFQVSTAKNEINLFNNHILIVAPVTFAPAGAMRPSAEFLYFQGNGYTFKENNSDMIILVFLLTGLLLKERITSFWSNLSLKSSSFFKCFITMAATSCLQKLSPLQNCNKVFQVYPLALTKH